MVANKLGESLKFTNRVGDAGILSVSVLSDDCQGIKAVIAKGKVL